MDRSWINQTVSPKPKGHPAAVWAEEVVLATGKSLLASAASRCVFGASGLGPSSSTVCSALLLLLMAAWLCDLMPVLGKPVEDKMYHSFESFWPRYLAEHREPRDRVAHVFEFACVLAFMALEPGRLVAFCLTIGVGSLLTRPLLHLSRPRLEQQLMYLIGGVVAQRFDVACTYALGYAVWLAFDFVGHAYLGENAQAAAFLGRHYLAWALVGQAHFAFKVAANFHQELLTARVRLSVDMTSMKQKFSDGGLKVSIAARAMLHYSKTVPGKRVGRYIGVEDARELADVHEECEVALGNARELLPKATLDTKCFELLRNPTSVEDFHDDEEIRQVYYKEMEALVKKATGAERVIVFDHTVRDTAAGSGLNVKAGEAGSAVVRVHTDYSDLSGPERVRTLASSGGYTGAKLSDEEKEDILSRDFCIVNVWRNIKNEPVQTKPLAVLDPSTIDRQDFITYEMQFAERKGENYAMRFNPQHQWYFYPFMEKDECLVFKTWEIREDRPRYCFHTSFDDLAVPVEAPPRSSIEIRTVAIMPRKK